MPRTGGAVVVIDVHNGEILAAASAPRFDPADFVGDDSARREALLADPAHPLFHRAIQMALPPGSVFKTVTAVALLESGGLDPAADVLLPRILETARPAAVRGLCSPRHGPRRRHAGRGPGRELQRLLLSSRRESAAAIAGRLGAAARLWAADGRRSAGRGPRQAAAARFDRANCRPRLAHGRHAGDVHRPGHADGHAAASRADDGRGGQRRTASHAARRAARNSAASRSQG